MNNRQAIADRVEIEALRGEYTDALMMRDWDRLTSLFAHDGAVRMPHVPAELAGRQEIRAGIERLQALLDYFVQTTHPGTIRLDRPDLEQVDAAMAALTPALILAADRPSR